MDINYFWEIVEKVLKHDGVVECGTGELVKEDLRRKRGVFEMNRPLISVIVATYRRVESLKAAIASVITQTYPNIEIVVVDDNASLEWNQKVETIVREFENIKYIQNKENQGSAETRNIGIRASKGEYITFLDDDDLYLPNKVAHQLSRMIEESADYSITDLFLYNENDKLVDRRVRSYIKDTFQDSLFKYHLMYHLTGTDTMMFHREYLHKIGGFPPINVGDEFYLMKEAICGGGKFIYLNTCDIKAYVHTSEGGLSSGDKKIKGENDLYKYKKQYFKDVSYKCRRYISMRHYAVLAFVEMRSKRYIAFIINGFKSFISAPIACLRLLLNKGKEHL